jgi:hypothetical protein
MRALLSANHMALSASPPPAPRAVREPFAPEYPAAPAPVGWVQQRFTHHNLPAGIVLAAPENLSMVDRQRLNQLLQAARQIFSGAPVIFMEAGQGGDSNDQDGSQMPGAKNAPVEEE